MIRQKTALLISNTNFDDPRFARFQPLSASIGRFFLKLIDYAINARQWKNTVSCCDHQCEWPMQQLPAPRPSELHRPAPR